MTIVVSEGDVDSLLTRSDANRLVEQAFRMLGEGTAENSVRQRVGSPGQVVNSMSAASHELGYIGVKVYPVLRTDVTQGSASTLLLYSLESGRLEGIIESDILGQRRTGAATWLATRLLAPAEVDVVTVFGAGWQAREQVRAVCPLISDRAEIHIISRRIDSARACADELAEETQRTVFSGTEPEIAVRHADIVIAATGSDEPVFDGKWLKEGTHINAVGSNYATKRELDRVTLDRSDVIVVDALDVAAEESGDFLLNNFPVTAAVPMDALVSDLSKGRSSPNQITLFESHGLAVQDLVCGVYILEQAQRQGIGHVVEMNGRIAETVSNAPPTSQIDKAPVATPRTQGAEKL